jgi:hypothetical protein
MFNFGFIMSNKVARKSSNLSKKIWLIALTLISLFLIFSISYWHHLFNTYPKKTFIILTGITKFEVKSTYHNDQDCYIETIISSADKQRVLNKFHFKPTPVDFEGNMTAEHLPKNVTDFLYCLDDKNKGLYAYNLYLVSKKDNTLIVYQCFGD